MCARFRDTPITLLLSGRHSLSTHQAYPSVVVYRHCCDPRPGGLAFALEALAERIRVLLGIDHYHGWTSQLHRDLMSGRVRPFIVRVRQLTIPPEFIGRDYRRPANSALPISSLDQANLDG